MIRRNKIKTLLALLFLTTLFWSPAFPGEIVEYSFSPLNSKIGFRLKATLHVVHGNATMFRGKVLIPQNRNPDELYAEISIPVKDIKTGNEKRDKKMHNFCFEMEKYPEIRFKSTGFKDLPAIPQKGVDFEFTILGDLTIKDVTRSIAMPVKVISIEDSFRATGTVTLNYLKDFNIKDPSWFIVRVAKKVEVFVEVDIPYNFIEKALHLKLS